MGHWLCEASETEGTSSQVQWLGQNSGESRKPDLQALGVGDLQLRLCDGWVWGWVLVHLGEE